MRFNTFAKKYFFVLIVATFGLTFTFKAHSIPYWSEVSSKASSFLTSARSFFTSKMPARKTPPKKQTFYLVDGRQQPNAKEYPVATITSDDHPEIFEYQKEGMAIAKAKIQSGENISLFTLTTSSGVKFPVKHFNRDSNKLLIIGVGLTSGMMSGNSHAATFYDYDIIKFEYRWHNWRELLSYRSIFLHPIRTIFDDCVEEVKIVVEHMRQQGNYDQIVGLPMCYSTYIFSQAQAQVEETGNTLFDKLIIDSSFSSLPSAICRLLVPRRHTISRILSPITKRLFPARIAIQHHLATITIPILFIHGSKDWLVSLREFKDDIWPYAVTTQKALLVTPFRHIRSMRGNPCAYKYFCDTFINKNFE